MDGDTRKGLEEVAAGNVEQFSIDELEGMGLTDVTSNAGRTDDDALMAQAQELLDTDPPVWKQNGDPRWFLMEFANDDNRIAEVAAAANMPLIGIGDEEAGGIVAYALADFAERAVRLLNLDEQADD